MSKIIKYNWLFNNSKGIKYLKSIEVKDKDKDTIKKNKNKLSNPQSIQFDLDYKNPDDISSTVDIQNSNTPSGTVVSANCLFRCCSKKPIIGFRRLSFSIEINQPEGQYWGPNWNIYFLSRKNPDSSRGDDRPYEENYYDARGGNNGINYGCEWDMLECNGQVFSVSTLHTNDDLWKNNFSGDMDRDGGKNYYFPNKKTIIPKNTWSSTRNSGTYNPIEFDEYNPNNDGTTTFDNLTTRMDFTLTVFPTSDDKLDIRLALKQNKSDKCKIIFDTRKDSSYFPRNSYYYKEKMDNPDRFRELAKQMIDDVGLWVMIGCSNNFIPGRNGSQGGFMDPYPEENEIVKTMGDIKVKYSNWVYT